MSASAKTQSALGKRVSSVLGSGLIEELAVLATFDPQRDVPEEQREAVAQISDRLTEQDGREEWMLKESVRSSALARLLTKGGGVAEAQAVRRRTQGRDTALQRVLDLTLREEPIDLERLTEDELLAALHVGRWCAAAGAAAAMPSLASQLDREVIEGRLALFETLRPIQEITRDGCLGRESELQRLRAYVGGPPSQRLTDRPPMLVYGVGGVGKSTLIARFLLDLAEAPEPTAWAYLDLDRASLSSYDPLVLLTDVIRQIGAQLPMVRRFLDYSGSEAAEKALGSGLEGTDYRSLREAAIRVANATNDACEGRLTVVLDTYEELQRAQRARGELDPRRRASSLFTLFDILSDYTRMFRLVVSGRAPASDFVVGADSGAEPLLFVGPFQGESAVNVLQHLYAKEVERAPDEDRVAGAVLDRALAHDVVETVGGIPLTLRVAARVLALEGEAGLADAEARAGVMGRVAKEFVSGFLYHRVLGHIRGVSVEDPEALQKVAMASLALRQVSADLLREVVLPAIGRPDLDADAMLTGLQAETALTQSVEGVVRLRDELRGPALLALRYGQHKLVNKVHRLAAGYYTAHGELPGAATELAYHLLAVGEKRALDDLDAAAVVSITRSATDLPPSTRALVASAATDQQALGEDLRREAAERETEAVARRALDAGDLDGAERALEGSEDWSPTTQLFAIQAQLAEARGDLPGAVAATQRDLSAALAAEDPDRYCAAAIRVALLLERTSAPELAVDVLNQADQQPWLAGYLRLRLELQLNRLVILERSHTGALDRWVLELDARALLQKADPDSLRESTALVRLLAATLGRDENIWVLEALRSVGLGTTTYSAHLRDLASALGSWEMAATEPGSVTRSVGLEAPEPLTSESLAEVWFQALAGKAADAVPLLDRAFSLRPPDDAVVEALRMIYLWWGLDPQAGIEEQLVGEMPPEHFLDKPLDLADSDAQQLLRALTGAYPSPEDVLVLASEVGLDLGALNVKTTSGLSTRSLLDEARRVDKMPLLIGHVLSDPRTTAFHDELQDLVGSEWLTRQGIVT
jgi:hypothetical protein